MSAFWLSIIGVVVVSLVSFIGALSLLISKKLLNKLITLLVSLSAGSLMGGAFFHLLPESVEMSGNSLSVFVYTIIGLTAFFVLEKVIYWRHCHNTECSKHQHIGAMNLVGDAIHNILDGMVIFAAFAVSPALGWPVVVSVLVHEVPQELGDFGVLLYAGFSKTKALTFNFIIALSSILGVIMAYILLSNNYSVEKFLVPFAAGGFLYIAATDLIPEMHKEKAVGKSVANFIIFGLA